MSQLWALVSKSGKCVYRYTNSYAERPDDAGHKSETKNRNVWPLEREPVALLGEVVNYETGAIELDLSVAVDQLVPAIKEWTQAEILARFPYWRQLNDIAEPEATGAAARRLEIKALRTKSNELEASAKAATTAQEIELIWQQITRV